MCRKDKGYSSLKQDNSGGFDVIAFIVDKMPFSHDEIICHNDSLRYFDLK